MTEADGIGFESILSEQRFIFESVHDTWRSTNPDTLFWLSRSVVTVFGTTSYTQ